MKRRLHGRVPLVACPPIGRREGGRFLPTSFAADDAEHGRIFGRNADHRLPTRGRRFLHTL